MTTTDVVVYFAGSMLMAVLVLLVACGLNPIDNHPQDDLSNDPDPFKTDKGRKIAAFIDPLRSLGARIMSVLDDALARFTTFVKDVVAQLKTARDTNDAQTGKLAELQAALDVALADDATDKAAIVALQSDIASLQESVAAQINAAVDALENAPTPEAPVEDVPAIEETPAIEENVTPAE